MPSKFRLRARHVIFGGITLALVAVNIAGLPYYLADTDSRLRHPLRMYFKPSGLVGQSLGLLALTLFLFLWLYPIRKKAEWLAFSGSLSSWLNVHIPAGLLVPVVAATHASWHFTGLIGLGYGAMFIVVLSGMVGRYLYGRLPRSKRGIELSRDELTAERQRLLRDLCLATGLQLADIERALAPARPSEGEGVLQVVRQMVADDLARPKAVRTLIRALTANGANVRRPDRRAVRQVARLARREMALAQQLRMLDAIRRLFRFWHAAHRPLALVALAVVLIHFTVAIVVGQTWFW